MHARTLKRRATAARADQARAAAAAAHPRWLRRPSSAKPRSSRALLLACCALLASCTQDFDSFYTEKGDGGPGGGGSAGAADASADGSGGAAGSSGGGGSGGSAGSVTGGAGGAGGTCADGKKACDDTCVDVNDPDFGCSDTGCAPCKTANATATCAAGACSIASCDPGFANCNSSAGDGCEVDLRSDPSNCGTCERICTLPHASAQCVNSECTVDACDVGFEKCDADEATGCDTNTAADPRACGSCANDCFDTPGNWECTTGQCALSSCPTGLANCDGTGCDVNTDTSLANCGFCGNACAPARATGVCQAGECKVLKCEDGYADCDNNPVNGCERNLKTDPDHCGVCDRSCSAAGVTTRLCQAGACAPVCAGGAADCATPLSPQLDDGCEVTLATDADHCGACGRSCSTSNVQSRQCSAGQCAPSCSPGFGDCTAPSSPQPDDGCETNISSNTLNCGACGRTCATAGVSALSCTGGLCTSSCTGTRGNCTRPSAPAADDGCERDLAADESNCGSCGRACSYSGVAVRQCTAGSCTSTCSPGFGNCIQPASGVADDGCETNLASSADNCGACGRPCSYANVVTRSCVSGLCESSCSTGFGNCATPAAPSTDNGCESSLNTDPANCGACDRKCSTVGTSSVSCGGGLCNAACVPGRGDCSRPAAPAADNGCETDTNTNVAHCGACSRACSTAGVASLSCSGGSCSPSCDLGLGDCSRPVAPAADNGCETNVSANASSCGACGEACPSGFACGSSTCGCATNSDCNAGGNGECKTGVCECDRIGQDQLCRPGERCKADGVQALCSCNGGGACGGSETCCAAGCKALATDAANCGACGHACPPGFACAGSSCACNGDASCNAGSAGTCAAGACKCGATTCAAGERCQANGSCG